MVSAIFDLGARCEPPDFGRWDTTYPRLSGDRMLLMEPTLQWLAAITRRAVLSGLRTTFGTSQGSGLTENTAWTCRSLSIVIPQTVPPPPWQSPAQRSRLDPGAADAPRL